jgi:hypothetical protein
MIGRFLEISVHAPDVLASLAFYERLGFTQVTTGEAWSYPYAVVTDGRLAIGLHQQELPQSPLLAFVLPELHRQLAALEAAGLVEKGRGEIHRRGMSLVSAAPAPGAGRPAAKAAPRLDFCRSPVHCPRVPVHADHPAGLPAGSGPMDI